MTTAPHALRTTILYQRLTGLSASGGVYQGVALRPGVTPVNADASVRPVLIITDDHLGPLAAHLAQTQAGAVLATGGVLSNLATVARELGIPMVSLNASQIDRIENGAAVTVDGNTGTVTIR
jgi:phosphoenolpyruvate-protein kinase (PTS system EI component)